MSGREQFMSREEGKNVLILSPLTGRAVPLEEVPDPVFSQKIIGDGMAVIPTAVSYTHLTLPTNGDV